MFTPEELDALALGARWVRRNGDVALAVAAERAMVKIAAVAPRDSGEWLDAPTQLVSNAREPGCENEWMPKLREAMRGERKVTLDYVDGAGASSLRKIWPVAVGFLRDVRMVAAWCETRAAFRHFRVDRIAALEIAPERYPKRRRALLAEWRKGEGLED